MGEGQLESGESPETWQNRPPPGGDKDHKPPFFFQLALDPGKQVEGGVGPEGQEVEPGVGKCVRGPGHRGEEGVVGGLEEVGIR